MAPKAKKPLSAKAKAKLREAKAAERAAAIERGDIVEKPKADGFKKKILASIADKTFAEASAEFKVKAEQVSAQLKELEAIEKTKSEAVDVAKTEYDKAKAAIEAAMAAEVGSATDYKATVATRAEVSKKVEVARNGLFEAQKKVAMMEVLAVNHSKMKALDEARKAAQQAAEDARKNMLEQKLREKEALEATKRALAEARQAMRPAKKAKTEESVAETQAADID